MSYFDFLTTLLRALLQYIICIYDILYNITVLFLGTYNNSTVSPFGFLFVVRLVHGTDQVYSEVCYLYKCILIYILYIGFHNEIRHGYSSIRALYIITRYISYACIQ